MDTIQGNKLIAGFMGWHDKVIQSLTPPNNKHYFVSPSGQPRIIIDYPIIEEDLKYHTSWDWLMPVVEKIMDIDITHAPNWTGYRIEIVPRGYVTISGFPMPTITTNVSIEGSNINAVWKAVVQFIEWYNKNQKLKP